MIEAKVLKAKLLARGYPNRLIRKSLKRAWFCPREELHITKEKTVIDRLICVTTFGVHTNKVRNLIMRNWNLIKSIYPTKETPMFEFKRGKNVKDHLISSSTENIMRKTNTLESAWGMPELKGHFKCWHCAPVPSLLTQVHLYVQM